MIDISLCPQLFLRYVGQAGLKLSGKYYRSLFEIQFPFSGTKFCVKLPNSAKKRKTTVITPYKVIQGH